MFDDLHGLELAGELHRLAVAADGLGAAIPAALRAAATEIVRLTNDLDAVPYRYDD
jgi:hypothetical protein